MITEKDNQLIANDVYKVDSKKVNEPFQQGDLVANDKYIIIEKPIDNLENGMQAMAVAPVVNGEVDKSRIVIAYAGTNAKDKNDINTDYQSVYGGNRDLSKPQNHTTAGQVDTALAFAKDIKDKYPNASISTTGHSLGEYLALLTSAENKWPNTGFNGPDPYNMISPEAKKWVKEHPEQLMNFKNSKDIIGIVNGNKTGSQILIDNNMHEGLALLNYHDLAAWQFDDYGNVLIPINSQNLKVIQEYKQKKYEASLTNIKTLKKKFKKSGGKLSSNEKIFLESSTAIAIVTTASTEFHSLLGSLGQIYKNGITEAEELWDNTLEQSRAIGTHLSESEIKDALTSVGFTEQSVVINQKEKFSEKLSQVNQMTHQFDELQSSIKASINKLVETDKTLASEISA